jgi:acetyl-CoA carboxylase carboxyl transferase subunit alpha
MAVLDFEKPLVELEKRVETLRMKVRLGEASSGELEKLESKLKKLRAKVMEGLTPWQRVQLARHMDRPHAVDFFQGMLEEFVELKGDRMGYEDPAVICGLGRLNGMPLVVMGHEKGRTPKERLEHRFGMPHPEGYRKASRLMDLAERFGRPVLSLVDTPGAYPGVDAEARGQAGAIAQNLLKWAALGVPSVAVVIGEGGSGGALALAMADRVLMMEHSVYSVISPEGCAAILWRDEAKKEDAAEVLKLTAKDAMGLGIIHEIVKEPPGGAHRDPEAAIQAVAQACQKHFQELIRIPQDERKALRAQNYRRMGIIRVEGAKAK